MQARQWWQLFGAVVLLLLLWKVSLAIDNRHGDFHHHYSSIGNDRDASLVMLLGSGQDKRGWLFNPLKAAAQAGLSGGASKCTAVHAGEIRPGTVRANHRHHSCNETFLFWNAEALFRVENAFMERGYAQAVVAGAVVSVATASAGRAHALANIDRHKTLFFVACQDARNPTTDAHVWPDL